MDLPVSGEGLAHMLSLRIMRDSDFPLILAWLAKPHVKEWWDNGDDTLEKVARRYGDQSSTNERFILLYHSESHVDVGLPIGYLQYEVEGAGVANIDQFIGEEAMLGRGIGTQAIKLLLDYMLDHHVINVVTVDPSPANKRAIRCYEKVGFVYDPTIQSPFGEEAYMMKIEY